MRGLFKTLLSEYKKLHDRNWDTLYFAVDIHGTILKNNYAGKATEFYAGARSTLEMLSAQPEVKLILWSSCYESEYQYYIDLITKDTNIKIDFFNENPLVNNTLVGDFSKKFYFNVLLDDKAGFDPDLDWNEIKSFYSFRLNERTRLNDWYKGTGHE